MNIFEFASRERLRFQSNRGELTTEQLWTVPLRSKDLFNLNEIAKGINQNLKKEAEDNFVDTNKTSNQTHLEVSLEVVKHIIQVKLEDEAAKAKAAANKVEKEKLLRILAEKQDSKLNELSEQEIAQRLAALG